MAVLGKAAIKLVSSPSAPWGRISIYLRSFSEKPKGDQLLKSIVDERKFFPTSEKALLVIHELMYSVRTVKKRN